MFTSVKLYVLTGSQLEGLSFTVMSEFDFWYNFSYTMNMASEQ